jgi:hypothetical protein
MDKTIIQAIGHFLSNYESDLIYISRFQDYKNGYFEPIDYCKKEEGSFYKFLIEFKVIRSIKKGDSIKLLNGTGRWINGDNPNCVDSFADHLKQIGLTRGSSKSMVSKIFFLNNPTEIIPMDRLTRESLNLRQNDYAKYQEKLEGFKQNNSETISDMMSYVETFLPSIHKDYREINKLEVIAKNRMIDKLLWTMGS